MFLIFINNQIYKMKKKNIFFFLLIIILGTTLEKENKRKSIFDETNIKKMKLKNRLIRGSVGDLCGLYEGKISEKSLELYKELSDDGVGTIITGCTTVGDYNQMETFNNYRIDKDEYIEEYKKLTSLVHKNNVNILMQIFHVGGITQVETDKIYAPSSIKIPQTNRTSIEMTKEDILRIEEYFEKAAIRAQKAGFDGVDIHAAHFYLLSEFLSPVFNKRTDEYGGNDENRARILIEIIQRIRKAVGNDFIISMKINCEDSIPGGITEEGFYTTCKLAEKAGIDMIQVSGMKWMNEKIKPKTPVYFKQTAKLAEIVKVPVVLVGGLRDVDTMEDAINNSHIQYLSIARPLICEPDIVKTWKHGDKKKSNCLNCNNCLKKGFCVLKDKEQLKK